MILDYVAKGYYVLPIWWLKDDGACACGKQGCTSPGKHPISAAVPRGVLDAANDPVKVAGWLQRYPRANWGLATGLNGLVFMDVDPRNGGDVSWDLLVEQWGEPPETWTQKTGGGGWHYGFRVPPEGVRPRDFGKGIDLKHGNSYILIEPSRTTGEYHWVDGTGPLEDSSLALWRNQPEAPKASIPGAPGMDAGTVETLERALHHIANVERADWLKVGMALHFGDPSPTGPGFALWDAWSQREPGGVKYQAKDQARTWRSFSRYRDQTLTLNSIYHWATEAGWTEQLPPEVRAAILAMTENMNRRQALNIVAPPAQGDMPKCPVAAIEIMAEWLGQGYRQASLAGALMACSLSTSRRYRSDDGSPAHVYIGIAASSINEIRYVLNGVERLFNEAGLRRLVRSGRFSNVGGLYKTLIKAPSTGYLTAEWETLLKFAKRQPSGAIDMVLNLLSDLHGRTFLQIDSAEEFGLTKLVSDDQPIIRQPALSMLALMSHEAIDLLAKTSEIGRGASEQMLLVHCDANDWREAIPLPSAAPTVLLNLVRKVRNLDAKAENELDTDLSRLFDTCAELEPHVINVPMTGDYAEWDAAIEQLSGARSMRPLLHGAKVNLRRLCVALAAWDSHDAPVITPAIRDWCGQWIIKSLRHYLETMDVMLNDGTIDLSQRVLSAILEAGPVGINMRALRQAVRKFGRQPEEERSKLIQQLLDDGDILGGGMKKGVKYVHASFAANNEAMRPDEAEGVDTSQSHGPRGFQRKRP